MESLSFFLSTPTIRKFLPLSLIVSPVTSVRPITSVASAALMTTTLLLLSKSGFMRNRPVSIVRFSISAYPAVVPVAITVSLPCAPVAVICAVTDGATSSTVLRSLISCRSSILIGRL